MWLFTGRYAHYGVAICVTALGSAFIATIFAAMAGRLAFRGKGNSGRNLKSDIIWGFIILASAGAFGGLVGFAEPVFVPGHGLNKGNALFLAVSAVLLGAGALALPGNPRRWRVLLLLAASGMILGDVAGWLRRSAQPSKYGPNYVPKLFRFDDGKWTAAPTFTDRAEFALSKRGVLWTLDLTGQLSSLDGDRWTQFGRTEFGEATDPLGVPMHRLALRDEEVWKATAKGVARFSGKSWRLFDNVLRTDWPVDMVAGRSGVWIVDFYGNLSHFDGKNWTVENLKTIASAPPPLGWNYWMDADEPARLTMTGNGGLWIFWHGLWRQEGETWGQVRVPGLNLTRALLIGHDEDSVWLRSEEAEIVSITAEGGVRSRHNWHEMGLSKRPEIRSLAVADGRVWVASSGGLLVLDGEHWQNVGHPADYDWIVDVTVAPRGSAWVWAVKELP
jgi:hypothetical protein